MNRKKIKAVIHKMTSRVFEYGKKVNHVFEKEDIHNFRVEVKTLRAFVRLLQSKQCIADLKITKKTMRLYHIAGALRDTQLELKKIADMQVELPAYKRKLHTVISTQKKEWEEYYSKKIFRKLWERFNSLRYERMELADLDAFLKTKMSSISQLNMIETPTNTDVHQIRKEAKDIIYNVRIAEKKWPLSMAITKEFPIDSLEEIADRIGTYHDEVVQLEHLTLFSSPEIEQDEQKTIDDICKRKTAELQLEKNAIMIVVNNMVVQYNKATLTIQVPCLQ
jgi:CHAD domain-containing protein